MEVFVSKNPSFHREQFQKQTPRNLGIPIGVGFEVFESHIFCLFYCVLGTESFHSHLGELGLRFF